MPVVIDPSTGFHFIIRVQVAATKILVHAHTNYVQCMTGSSEGREGIRHVMVGTRNLARWFYAMGEKLSVHLRGNTNRGVGFSVKFAPKFRHVFEISTGTREDHASVLRQTS